MDLAVAGHVGLLRVCGGSVRAAAAAHDAECQGGGEVHVALRLCAGPVPLHQLRALDPADHRWRVLPPAGHRQWPLAHHGPHL